MNVPTVTEKPVTAFAHCVNPRCPGSQQEQVDAIRRETERTYREMGGDAPGVEVSWVALVFADEEQSPCGHCGRARDLSAQERVTYPGEVGNPMALLGVPEFDPDKQQELAAAPMTDEERQAAVEREEELRGKLAAQQAQIDAILAAQRKGPE